MTARLISADPRNVATRRPGRPMLIETVAIRQPKPKPSTPTPLTERYSLTIDEAATYTGVCTKTLRRHIGAGTLPATRISRKLFIVRTDLESWMRANPA